MVWIWADADAHELAETVPLPISPLLQQFLKDYPDSGYMRDLPYGMELLGENLADLSHLPFSHHSVAGFDRNDAKPLNLKLWSEEERTKAAKKEVKAVQEASKGSLSQPIVVPRFQTNVLNAAETDPSMIARSKFKRATPNNNTMATTAFYDPCHIRYRRLFGASNSDKTNGANIEMFLCPIGPGKSRVMLFNSFERFLQHNLEAAVQEKKSLFGRWKQRFIHSRIRNYFLGASARGHRDLNGIFDGDAVFLNQQGLQMATEGLKPSGYSTPSTADVAVRSFRRWLDAASAATDRTAIIPTHAAKMAVKSVAGPLITDPTRADRTTMLDRYNQHTKNCKVCSEALAGLQRRQKVLARLSSFLLGVSGSAVTLAVFSAVSSLAGNLAKRFSSILAIASILASWLVRRHAGTLCQKIQEFHYVGYDHSTKDY
ncbi:Pheophorbide a oxygenase [Seminavis robusta]|uniref:Pheophorbide a oxygenase n=1 Tax=Seminavis robusta TaxID=568900 RepID=A0A9N8D8R9_9STRA|nr:Pheophorbide a oxygenase [Seminavis robusta]|eukprot:Sro17_g012370.1 Pheophorbide a oxygenase (430) ;mRNA; f:90407-91696